MSRLNQTTHMNLSKLLFGKYPSERRRKELRHLCLALVLGALACCVIGAILYVLQMQGRF
jgi:hypothetical protein